MYYINIDSLHISIINDVMEELSHFKDKLTKYES